MNRRQEDAQLLRQRLVGVEIPASEQEVEESLRPLAQLLVASWMARRSSQRHTNGR